MERRITVRESMENTNTKWRSLSNAAFRQQLLSLRADCRAATSRNFRKPRFFPRLLPLSSTTIHSVRGLPTACLFVARFHHEHREFIFLDPSPDRFLLFCYVCIAHPANDQRAWKFKLVRRSRFIF